jgi:UDP-glucose 4-epimerase
VKVLVTGGAGFIGSTICSALLDAGHTPVILDDLSTGLAARTEGRIFYRGDIADPNALERIVDDHPDLAATIHCAAFIVAPDSVTRPLVYYSNNVARSIALFDNLSRLGIKRLLFSSSAAIYAPDEEFAVDENSPIEPDSPYGMSKAMVERVLQDACRARLMRAISLRYFNPIGADPQRRSGPPTYKPSHVLGRLIEAYETGLPFTITGLDWPTRDGSGLRDYIHVWDLARAHVRALELFDSVVDPIHGYDAINIGTGRGTTVRELVAAFNSVTGARVPVLEAPARPGDIAGSYTRTDKAHALLGWRAEYSVADGVRDALEWAQREPASLVAAG